MRKYTPEQCVSAFWAKVDKSGGDDACWLWTGCLNSSGYGNLRWARKTVSAHRVSWELTYGTTSNNLLVLHNCPGGDNPACVNPRHLFLGTNLDNARDRHAKGRDGSHKGELNGNAKITAQLARYIREQHSLGKTERALALEINVSQSLIAGVVTGRAWKHAP